MIIESVSLESLSELVTKGTTPTKKQGYIEDGINFIRALSIDDQGNLNEGTFLGISEETNSDLKRSILQEGDVLFTIAGVIGRVAIVEERHLPANVNQAVAIIRPKKDKISSIYLANLLRTHIAQFYLQARVVESVQKNLSLGELRSLPVEAISLEEQGRRTKFLKNIREKFRNDSICSDLSEEIISTLFISWFVFFNPVKSRSKGELPHGMDPKTASLFPSTFEDSEIGKIPTGWKVGRLKDTLVRNKDSTTPGDHLSNRYYVPIENIDSKSLSLKNWQTHEEAASSLILFSKNDLLFGAMRPYFHKVTIAPFEGVTRSTCFVLRPKIPGTLRYCLCLLNLDSTVRYATDSSLGTTMPYSIWENGLADHKIVIPPEEIMIAFSEKIQPMIEKIRDLGLNSRTLSSIRSELLDGVISGELGI